MTNDFLIQLVFCQKKNGGLIYWCWNKTGDEVGEFTLNAVKMVVCLNSVVSFDMYSQQFTLCYCPAKAFFLVFTFKICLRHQSVTPFLSDATSPLKNPWSAPASVACLFIHNFEHFSEQSNSMVSTVVRYPAVFECLPWYQFHQYVLFQRAEFDAFLYSYARQVLVSKKESCTDWVYVSWSRSISVLNFLGWLLEKSCLFLLFF